MNEARRLFELLEREFDGLFAKAEQIKIDSFEVVTLKLSLQEKLTEARKLIEQNTLDKESIIKEREYFSKTNAEADLKLRGIESQKKELEEERTRQTVERQEIKKTREEAEVIIFKAHDLQEQLKDLASQKQLIEKEKSIDKERKEILDIREDKISRREQQLQMQADI